jgi:pimeloyl-ACP methyl ester carboxylesterase
VQYLTGAFGNNRDDIAVFSYGLRSTIVDRRTFSMSVAAGVAGSLLGISNQARAAVSARSVVFLHGLFADGSCWSEVIGRLQPLGFSITSVQNPLRSFEDDVATARRALKAQDGPTVLVAHSYSGMIACEVGTDPKVSALVFVAARAPDAGEDYAALAAKYPSPQASAGVVTSEGFSQLTESAFLTDFANGVEPAKARELYAVQQPYAATLTKTAKTTVAAWRSKPSWYAVSKQDRTIDPDLERFMAARMKATTIEVDAGHLSLVSHAPEVATLILQAAG